MNARSSIPLRSGVDDLKKQRVRVLWNRIDDEEFFSHPFIVVLKSDINLDRDDVGFYTDIASSSHIKNLDEIVAGRLLDPESIAIRVVSKKAVESPYAMVTIGRTSNCDIVIPSKVVSKFHAYFIPDPAVPGSYRIADGGSKNGTFLNSNRLLKNAPEAVANGDRIELGMAWAFRFFMPGEFRKLLKASYRG